MGDTNEHYISKAYLDNFVHPSSEHAVLYPYGRERGAYRPSGTKRLGSAINFYRQKTAAGFDDRLDEARKRAESLIFSSSKSNVGSLARCVVEDSFALSAQDRADLAGAAAFLFCGSPVQIHNVAMHVLLLYQMDFLNWHNTEDVKAAFREQFGDEAEDQLAESRKKALNGELFMDVGEENWKQLGFTAFLSQPAVTQLLMRMRLTVVDCHPKSVFLTSDNPVVRTYPSDAAIARHKWDDEMWFPISHKRGLLWHRRNCGSRERFGHSQCRSLNRQVIKHAYKFIYSPRPEEWIGTAVTTAKPAPLLGHYESLEKVIAASKPAIDTHGRAVGEIVDSFAVMRDNAKVDVLRI